MPQPGWFRHGNYERCIEDVCAAYRNASKDMFIEIKEESPHPENEFSIELREQIGAEPTTRLLRKETISGMAYGSAMDIAKSIANSWMGDYR